MNLDNLEKKLTLLEARMAYLEQTLSVKPPAHLNFTDANSKGEPQQGPQQEPLSTTADSQAPPTALSANPSLARPGTAPATASATESSTQLLPLIATICFVLAGVFIVRMAIESGWLTPARQWGLLALLGVALSLTGRWLEIIEAHYRSYLSAAGIVVLYMAAYSSSLYFELFPSVVALILAMGVSAISLALFNYHKNELFPILTSVGTYISPVLLGQNNDLIFNSCFFVIWSWVFATMSNFLSSRTLNLTAAYFGIGIFAYLNLERSDSTELMAIIAVQIIQFVAFAGSVYLYTIAKKNPLSRSMASAYLPVLLFFYATTYYFMNRLNPTVAPWVSLAFALAVYLLHIDAQKKLTHKIESDDLVYGFLTVVLIHSGYLQILPELAKPWLLPVFLLLSYISKAKKEFPVLSGWLSKLFLIVAIIEYCKMSYSLMNEFTWENLLPSLAAIFTGAFYYAKGSKYIGDKTLLFLGGLHLLAVLALYRIAADYGSIAVSLIWGIYSLLVLIYGYQKKDQTLAKSSLMVFILASLKALIYDASQASSGVRIVSLLLTGVLLYGAGILFNKIKKL